MLKLDKKTVNLLGLKVCPIVKPTKKNGSKKAADKSKEAERPFYETLAPEALIEQVDKALARYYGHFKREYDELFKTFCEENGYENVLEEMTEAENPTECSLVDFEESEEGFPGMPSNSDDAAKARIIYGVLEQCIADPVAYSKDGHFDALDIEFKEEENLVSKIPTESEHCFSRKVTAAKWETAFGNVNPVVLPVIHVNRHDYCNQIEKNINLIIKHKFNGCFLINHKFSAKQLIPIIKRAKDSKPMFWIGVKFVKCPKDELDFMKQEEVFEYVNGLWSDNAGVKYSTFNEGEITSVGAERKLAKYEKYQWSGLYFGGTDVKESSDDDYIGKCKKLATYVSEGGFMDCLSTTAKGTGDDADLEKIKAFREGCDVNGSKLAIVSGVTPENVKSYLPYVDAMLVDGSIGDDLHKFNDEKMAELRKAIDEYNEEQK